jgi:hypothetical protein
VFVVYENIVCTLKWPSLKEKIRKTKKSQIGMTPVFEFKTPNYSSVDVFDPRN